MVMVPCHDDDYDTNGTTIDDDVGLPAYSHHDRFPPWWVFVCDDNGGNMSGDKIPPLHYGIRADIFKKKLSENVQL